MRTLALDCGGTGLKAIVLDAAAEPLCERVRVRTPYPCPPERLVAELVELAAATGTPYNRVSVGLPGAVRRGVVLATPHYVTETGPHTPARPDLVEAWTDFDVRAAVEAALGAPTRAVNDAELAGLAVIEGSGFEVVLTLGTGLGCALFDEGRLLPKVELSLAPFRKGQTYDEQLGNHVRKRIGADHWSRRVRRGRRRAPAGAALGPLLPGRRRRETPPSTSARTSRWSPTQSACAAGSRSGTARLRAPDGAGRVPGGQALVRRDPRLGRTSARTLTR